MNPPIADTPLVRAEASQLVVVDAQTKLAAAIPEADRNRAVERTGLLLEAAEILQLPRVATEQYPRGLGPTDPAVACHFPRDMPVLSKTAFSCCGADGFMDALDIQNRPQIVLSGMEAHVCVLQTAFDLQARGFHVYVAEDAVCSRSRDNHRNAMGRLRLGGIVVTNAESVIFEWLNDAQHAQFKAISALLK